MNEDEFKRARHVKELSSKLLKIIRLALEADGLDVRDPNEAAIAVSAVLRCGFAIAQSVDRDLEAALITKDLDTPLVSINVKRSGEKEWMNVP